MTAAVTFDKPCPQCGGTGLEPDHRGYSCDGYCCPSCFDGMVPDDATVERGAKQIEHYLEEELFLGLEGVVDFKWLAEAVLVAAARYQSEGKP